MITIEILQAELEKTKRALTFHLARKQELEQEAAAEGVFVNKAKGRIDLLMEQVKYLQASAAAPVDPAE